MTGSKVPGTIAVTLRGISSPRSPFAPAGRPGSPGRDQEAHLRVAVTLDPLQTPREPHVLPAGGLDDDHGARREHGAQPPPEIALHARERGVGRVCKHESIQGAAPSVSLQGAAHVGGGDASRARRHVERGEIGAQHGERGAIALDEGAARGAARERLDAQGAAAGVQVEHAVAGRGPGGSEDGRALALATRRSPARARARAWPPARRRSPRAPCPRSGAWRGRPAPSGAGRATRPRRPSRSPPTESQTPGAGRLPQREELPHDIPRPVYCGEPLYT